MKTYANKFNAQRAAIKAIVAEFEVEETKVKANPEQYFTIEGDKKNRFFPHYKTDRELLVKRRGIRIEKNRPERNGVQRPSAGGKCRAIWDYCDELNEKGVMPMPKLLKKVAAEKGWNANNAIIEMYQWRKFNGIVGRQNTSK